MTTTNGFTNTYAYKLRGRYSNGTNNAISIADLNLHHTFTITSWVLLDTLTDTGTVFAKEKGGNYAATNNENLLELQITAAGALKANMYFKSNELFEGDAISATGEIDTGSWYAIAYMFEFDGETTSVTLYKNAGLLKTHPGLGVYLEDKDSYTQAWLLVATDSVNSSRTPARGLNAFMYRFKIWNTANVSNVNGDYTTISCDGGCSYCPTNVGPTNGSICLWTSDRDQYVDDSNASQDCQAGCGLQNGCVRDLDCNRCHDRLCETCINFDEGATCSACITRASDTNGVCKCDD
jgi:hypothetical protein